MITTVSDLQRFLVSKGALIAIDGKGGPATRAAILSVFSNRAAPAVNHADLVNIASRLGGSLAQVRAVARVESAGGAFNDAGQPKALYERHYAWRRLRIKIPFLSDPAPGGYTMDADRDGINDSWEKIADMACRNPVVAFESASFGKFQVMGAHWKTLGYAGPVEMVYSLVESEYAHYELLARFIERNGLVSKFRAISADWRTCTAFARAYNGPAQKGYDRKIADAMANP